MYVQHFEQSMATIRIDRSGTVGPSLFGLRRFHLKCWIIVGEIFCDVRFNGNQQGRR